MTRVMWLAVLGILLLPSLARAQSEQVIYYHTDAIGSVRMITDATGAVVARYDYLPFGELCESQCGAAPTPDLRQYAGKEREADFKLDYFGARYLRAQSGRFITVDPVINIEAALTDPQQWNRYAYAVNRPFVMVDPDGRNPVAIGGIIGVGVYAAWKAYVNVQAGQPWHTDIGVETAKGFVLGATLGLASPAIGLPTQTGLVQVGTSSTAIGFAAGTGRAAFVADRLQHASRHLTEAGILGNWSKATGQRFTEIGAQILENPRATFDYVLRGNEAVKGFLGSVDGKNVVFFVYKTRDRAGQVATAIVPSDAQLAAWGYR